MLSHEVPLMTAFTFHSKSFLTSRHYHPAEKATFFPPHCRPIISSIYILGNVMKFLFTPFKLSFSCLSFYVVRVTPSASVFPSLLERLAASFLPLTSCFSLVLSVAGLLLGSSLLSNCFLSQ